ncbi:hypothetical protein D3C73_729490 [compost metagenome]
MLAEVYRTVSYESSPIQIMTMNHLLAVRSRRFNLRPTRIRMAPEGRPPSVIQGTQRAVFLLQPFTEMLLTIITVAFTAIFIGNVPTDHGRVIRITFSQLAVHDGYLLSVHRRGVTMIMAPSLKVAYPILLYPQNLGVFLGHPGRSGTARRCEPGIDAILRECIQYAVQPFKGERTFLRLQCGPGKDAYSHHVAFGQLHQTDVFFQHLGGMLPLIRVVIRSMHKSRQLGADWLE